MAQFYWMVRDCRRLPILHRYLAGVVVAALHVTGVTAQLAALKSKSLDTHPAALAIIASESMERGFCRAFLTALIAAFGSYATLLT